MKRVYNYSRYFVAMAICFYGFAKLNGSQFTVLYSELDKPMGQVPGFWLTWHYFGYSKVYGNFIAIMQIMLGLMITFKRTTLLSAFILSGMLANIVLIDIFYGVAFGGTTAAIVLFVLSLFIVLMHRKELIDLFFKLQNSFVGNEGDSNKSKYLFRVCIIIIPAILTYFIANFNNRHPTEIDGGWELVSNSNAALNLPQKIYFEHERAFMCVFKFENGKSETHHFEVSPTTKEIFIYDKLYSKEKLLFKGHYDLKGSGLSVNGNLGENNLEMELAKLSL